VGGWQWQERAREASPSDQCIDDYALFESRWLDSIETNYLSKAMKGIPNWYHLIEYDDARCRQGWDKDPCSGVSANQSTPKFSLIVEGPAAI
jgi:hypothetical protein